MERTCDLDYALNCSPFDVRKYSGIEGSAASASSMRIWTQFHLLEFIQPSELSPGVQELVVELMHAVR